MIPCIIINLKRSIDRKKHITDEIKKANIEEFCIFFEGVDCETDLSNYNYNPIPNWKDPNNGRPLLIGEIGCGLAHYSVWKYMLENNILQAVVLEDDAVLCSGFKETIEHITTSSLTYDLFYLHRNKRSLYEEMIVNDGNAVIDNPIFETKYSYDTSSYILTYEGAKKLIQTPYLQYILPVDELLPIMYDDDYPYKQYSQYYDGFPRIRAINFEKDVASRTQSFISTIDHSSPIDQNT
jgi:collagen beta-1,O-galactosyltransferase